MSPLDVFALFLKKFDSGHIFLPSGQRAEHIVTRGKPESIWVSEEASGNNQVCQGGVNTFGVTLVDDGFIFHVDIKTDGAQFRWLAILE